jgi:hypothetical protein
MSRRGDLNFDVTIQNAPQTAAQIKMLQSELNKLPHNTNMGVTMTLHDQITAKLQAIYAVLAKVMSNVFDVDTKGLVPKLKALKTLITGMFRSDESKKWYEKVFGFLTNIGKQAEKVGTIITGIFGAAGAVVAIGAVVAMGLLVKQSITLNSQFEQFQVSLQTTLGSLTAAKNEMKGIVQFAKETPYTIQEVTDAVVKLRAYAMDPAKWLRPLGDMASAFGRTVTDAVEAAADAAMGMFRRSLSYGIHMERADFKQGGKYAGMSYADAFLMEVTKRFKGGMLLQAQTLKGIWSNIKDTMTIQITQATKPIYNAIKGMVSDFYNKINDPAYMQKLQDRFAAVTKVVFKVVDGFKALVNYVQINIVPVFASFGDAALKTFTSIVKIVGAFTKALGSPVLTVIGAVVKLISDLVVHLQWFIKAIVALKLARFVFALISKDIAAMSLGMMATGQATTLLTAKLSILTTRALKMGAALAGLMIIQKFLETRAELKAVGSTFNSVGIDADKVKGYLEGLGNQFGQTLDNMAKAANASKEFGANAVNALIEGAKAANILNMSAEQSVQTIGKLAKAYIGTSTDASTYAKKTSEVAAALEHMQAAGVQMDDVLSALEQYPEVMRTAGDSLSGLTKAIIAYKEATNGADTTKLLEMLSQLTTPDVKMLTTLDPTIWVSKSTQDLRDMGTEGAAYADTLDDIMKRNNILGQSYDSLGNSLGTNIYTMNEVVAAVRKLSAAEKQANIDILNWTDAVQQTQEDLDAFQNQLDSINLELTKVNDTMAQTSSVLSLAIAVNQMKAFNQIVGTTGLTISQMNDKISAEEAGLAKLQGVLDKVEAKFADVSDQIQKAQADLDKFTHPRLEGMGAFDDKLHSIDMQLNSLNRQKLDIQGQLKGFEQAGLTGTDAYKRASAPLTAIQAAIDKLENDRQKTQLDQSIAYDDQLYKLGKIADTQKEITFDAAVKGANTALDAINKLQPQMDALGAQKDNLAAQVKLVQDQISVQKSLVDQKQKEIDAQNILLQGELDRLNLQKTIYDLEAGIVDEKLKGAKIDAMSGKVSPANLKLIQDMYSGAAKQGGGLTQQATSIQNQMATKQVEQTGNNKGLADAQAQLSVIQGDMKALTTIAPQLIDSLNYAALVAEHQDALEAVFGKDNAGILKSMNDYLSTIADNGGPGQSGGLGWTGKLKNAMTGSTLGMILSVIGIAAGGALAKRALTTGFTKGVPALSKLYKESERITAMQVKAAEKGVVIGRDTVGKFGREEGRVTTMARGRVGEMLTTGKTGSIAERISNSATYQNERIRYDLTFGKTKPAELGKALTQLQADHLANLGALQAEQEKILAAGLKERAAMAQRVKSAEASIASAKLSLESAIASKASAEKLNVLQLRKEAADMRYSNTIKESLAKANARGLAAKDIAAKIDTTAQKVVDITKLRPGLATKQISKETAATARTIMEDLKGGVEDVGKAVKTARQGILGKGGGLVEKLTMGGIFGPILAAENLKGATAGKGVSRLRGMLYSAAGLLGTGEAIGKGKIVQRTENVYSGKISGRIMQKLGIRRGARGLGDIPVGQLGSLGTTSYGLPSYVAQDMMDRGMKPSPEFFSQMKSMSGVNYKSAEQNFSRFIPKTNSIELATQGRAAMDSKFGLSTYFHELGHAQAPKAELTAAMADRGGKSAVAAEFNAWKRAADSMKLAGVENPMAMKDFRGAASRSLFKYTGKGKESMQVLEGLVSGNKLMGIEKAGGAIAKFLGPLMKIGEMGGGKVGMLAKGAGKFGMLAGLGDVSVLAKPVENILSKLIGKGAGVAAGKSLGFLGKTLMGGGPIGLAMMAIQGVNFLKGGFMNEKVWTKLFGGKTIQQFVKDNPVSRAMYKTFGKGNVEAMFKPIGNIWDAATHATEAVGNVGGMATGLFKGIFTGNWSTFGNNAKGLAKNIGGMAVDVGKTLVNTVKAHFAFAKAIGSAIETVGPVVSEKLGWLGGKIADGLSKADEWINAPFKKAWAWIADEKDGMASWPGKIGDFFTGIGSKIADSAGWIWDKITWPFRTAWDWFTGDSGPASWPDKIAGFFSGIGGKIWSFIKDVGDTIKKPFVTAWDWLATLPDKFLGFVRGIGDAIANGAKWVGKQALKIGIEIVRALLWIPEKVQDTVGKIPWIGKYLNGSELLDISGIRDSLTALENSINAGSYDIGGVTKWAKNEGRLALLHGEEAVIPLKNGNVPVAFNADAFKSGTLPASKTNTVAPVTNHFGPMTFVVRNDDDMETLKSYMLKLMQGQAGFLDNPSNY